jgi:hypothetical protein
MSYSRRMLDTYRTLVPLEADVVAAAIEALHDCAQACTADVDADLSEANLADMVKCIRLCLQCADLCHATAGVTSRLAEHDAAVTTPLLQACVASCRLCGDECERHGPMHEHCRICAEACRRCERACQQLLVALE